MTETESLGRRLAWWLESGTGDNASLSVETRQRLLAALVRRYARGWLEERAGGNGSPPFAADAVSAEDVLVTAAQMLRSVEVTSFELASLFDV